MDAGATLKPVPPWVCSTSPLGLCGSEICFTTILGLISILESSSFSRNNIKVHPDKPRHYRPFSSITLQPLRAEVPRQRVRCSEFQVPQPVAREPCLKQNPLAPLPVAANSWPLRTQPSPAQPSQRQKPVNVDSLFFSSSKPPLLIDHSPRVDRSIEQPFLNNSVIISSIASPSPLLTRASTPPQLRLSSLPPPTARPSVILEFCPLNQRASHPQPTLPIAIDSNRALWVNGHILSTPRLWLSVLPIELHLPSIPGQGPAEPRLVDSTHWP